ncbi:DinB family protein [Pseudonocardia humida]|uniref:DinB family protein n=1 Tax=Pseudonocardia humida TaxID=2800819 RepID=A0ABT1A184_9PSEU|nr:DinB family protein [Pseudonocardia humida]MCO1656721.1 DinB family protein [Pseudonocardia humida]
MDLVVRHRDVFRLHHEHGGRAAVLGADVVDEVVLDGNATGALDRDRAARNLRGTEHGRVDRAVPAGWGGPRADQPDRVDAYADRSPDELLALVRAHPDPRGLTAGFGGRIALTDGTIHHQDIRRPPALPRQIPADRLLCVLDFARAAPTIGAEQRIKGLTSAATDPDRSTGSGPIVEGPVESLLMALARRRGVVGELSAPGHAMPAERIGG